ncbi:fructosamine kinase family protein [Cytophagaceae bacterium ABcell3]|nr:fructosamine kinase family protein [Cytophagaceae bacterium ABcell3]
MATEHDLNLLLSALFNKPYETYKYSHLSGGCINTVYLADGGGNKYVVKVNDLDKEDMFRAEAAGVKELGKANAVKVPEIIAWGTHGSFSYILMEYVVPGVPNKDYWENLGRCLAKQHQVHGDFYGFLKDNYIGSLHQENEVSDDWFSFFINKRLQPQVRLALANGKLNGKDADKFSKLYTRLPSLLVKDKPALLHGDLWSGNVVTADSGYAALIDPAVYYGHREIELAFTKLFGGFGPGFYAAYQETNPVEYGFEGRSDIYNLYPLLVHVNLFGGSYINSVRSILNRFV